MIGPSGYGKSTFLKTLNRMNDLIDNVRIEGSVTLGGEDIYAPGVDETILRKRVGMVFQQPNPFPMVSMTISRMVPGYIKQRPAAAESDCRR